MTNDLTVSREARDDLTAIYAYLFEKNPDSAELFLSEARSCFHRLAELPGIGHVWRGTARLDRQVRVFPLSRRFDDWLVFYRECKVDILIVRVLNGRRNLAPIIEHTADDNNSE